MTPSVKCRRCRRFIVRNAEGEWVLPNSKYPSALCLDGVHPHDPDSDPDNDGMGIVYGVAIGASITDAGLI